MSLETTWAIVARRNGLGRRQAARLFPSVIAYGLDHFEVVRQAVRQELAAAIERITAIETTVSVAMATFDEEATALLGGAS
jgi:hypothetical protein